MTPSAARGSRSRSGSDHLTARRFFGVSGAFHATHYATGLRSVFARVVFSNPFFAGAAAIPNFKKWPVLVRPPRFFFAPCALERGRGRLVPASGMGTSRPHPRFMGSEEELRALRSSAAARTTHSIPARASGRFNATMVSRRSPHEPLVGTQPFRLHTR